MITIDKSHTPEGAPTVLVRVTWIEPTYEVAQMLQEAGLTESFKSIHGQFTIPEDEARGLNEQQADEYLTRVAESMLAAVGGGMLQLQVEAAKTLPPPSPDETPIALEGQDFR